MKKLSFLLFFFIFLFPSPYAFSRSKTKPVLQRVAFVALKDTGQESEILIRVGHSLENHLQKLYGFSFVPQEQVQRSLEEGLSGLMTEEVVLAQSQYYQFRFAQAENLLIGRMDEEALKWRALVSFSEGHQGRARFFLEKLLKNFKKVEFSSRDYPPRFVTFFKEVSKKITKDGGSLLKIGKTYFVYEGEIESWKSRFQKLLHRMEWDYLVLYRMEKIGWNHKVTTYLFSQKDPERIWIKAVEIMDVSDLSKAANILVKTVFSVDTPQPLK